MFSGKSSVRHCMDQQLLWCGHPRVEYHHCLSLAAGLRLHACFIKAQPRRQAH